MASAVAADLAQVDVAAVAAIAVDPAALVQRSTVILGHSAALHVVPCAILSVLEAEHAVWTLARVAGALAPVIGAGALVSVDVGCSIDALVDLGVGVTRPLFGNAFSAAVAAAFAREERCLAVFDKGIRNLDHGVVLPEHKVGDLRSCSGAAASATALHVSGGTHTEREHRVFELLFQGLE